MNQIQEEWNKEEVQTHSNIPMEANIEYDESEEDECFNVDNEGVTSSTFDRDNDHSPIQKEEVESRNTKVINGKTYVVYESDDDCDFFVNNTPNSEIVNTLNEKSTCDEDRKDYDDLLGADFDSDDEDLEVIQETDEEWLVKSLNENCDTCDIGESMDFFRNTEDPVMREIMQGLSNPLHESLSNNDPPKLEVVSQRSSRNQDKTSDGSVNRCHGVAGYFSRERNGVSAINGDEAEKCMPLNEIAMTGKGRLVLADNDAVSMEFPVAVVTMKMTRNDGAADDE
ncbi:uncharacterized protein LOC113306227 [Papaver somniferum]|uniref:uncharacterized protein LOC113306227 n=1 Tax=Papaver somniferum TaxID=3469 RepID=UPI000E6F8845|nr:uncharacterized protein LOC113306227 [Papaver somniferum]